MDRKNEIMPLGEESKWFQPRFSINGTDLFYITCMIFSGVFLFWKASKGYMFNDEPFCLTCAQRLVDGEALLIDEWNAAQMIGFLLYPFVFLYKSIFGDYSGIFLSFRYLYLLMWTASSVFIYIRFRSYGVFSIIAVLYFYLFAPLDYMTLSYTSIGLNFLMLFASLICVRGNNRRIELVASGFSLSVSVLCCPYLSILYVLISILIAINALAKSWSKYPAFNTSATFRDWLFITLGILILFIPFVVFLISRASLQGLADNLPLIFSISGNGQKNIASVFQNFFLHIYNRFTPLIILGCPILFVIGADSRRFRNRCAYFALASIVWAVQMYPLIKNNYAQFNTIMLPISLLGVTAYMLTEKRNPAILRSFLVAGLVYSFSLNWSSNTGFTAISMGSTLCGFGSILLIGDFMKEVQIERDSSNRKDSVVTACACLVSIVFAIQIGGEGFVRATRTYWDSGISQLSERISKGPAKGLYTTAALKGQYESILDSFNALTSGIKDHSRRLLVLTAAPWLYLEADMKFATFSSWTFDFGPIGKLMEIQKKYYDLHPKNVPDTIFVIKDSEFINNGMRDYAINNGYSISEHDGNYLLKK